MSNQPTLAELERHLEDLARYASWLRDGHLPTRKGDITVAPVDELYRRNTHHNLRDGWPTGGNGAPSSGGDISNPTLAVAAANVDGAPNDHDRVHDTIVGLAEHIVEARNHLAAAISRSALVLRIQSTTRHSNEPTACRACTRIVECTTEDRIRAGYCSACDMAWRRHRETELAAGREPDRALFEHNRPKHNDTAA